MRLIARIYLSVDETLDVISLQSQAIGGPHRVMNFRKVSDSDPDEWKVRRWTGRSTQMTRRRE